MSVVFLLVPLAVGILVVAIAAFMWAVRDGQYDDLDTPATRILHDDDDDSPAR